MIVTLTGAYRNVGDHLIGHRAHQLLRKYLDTDIVNIDRKNITAEHYDVFNKARAVILCGGPAYQAEIFPNVYSLDLSKIKTPVIPYGLGYKAKLTSDKFKFTDESLKFVKTIHSHIKNSSARDVKTVDALNQNGIMNVIMTGCPAWYDIDKIGQGYNKPSSIKSVAFSSPALVDENALLALKMIKQRYPNAKKYITFHHGIYIGKSKRELKMTLKNVRASISAMLDGFEVVDLQTDLPKMCRIYDECDLHVGYRVHAHLYKLSQRGASILLSEDQRGVSQSITLGLQPILTNQDNFKDLLLKEFENVETGESLNKAFATMNSTFETMKNYVESIPHQS